MASWNSHSLIKPWEMKPIIVLFCLQLSFCWGYGSLQLRTHGWHYIKLNFEWVDARRLVSNAINATGRLRIGFAFIHCPNEQEIRVLAGLRINSKQNSPTCFTGRYAELRVKMKLNQLIVVFTAGHLYGGYGSSNCEYMEGTTSNSIVKRWLLGV